MNADETVRRAAREKQLARQKAERAWKTFLETVPPNVPATIENLFGQHHPQARTETWSVALPEIELHCETCDGRRIFATCTDYLFNDWTIYFV